MVAQRQSFKVKTDTVHVEHRYLTVKECAEFTGISVKTLYRWSREEKMPNRKIGHILRFDRAEIEKWIDRFKGGDTNVDLLDC
ncbi:MAG: hypothetical protein A2452_07335 [Candidatus Firestonebacteria bacterium RIFOXYC2_FULL_39_67]|nr:MAG: hypothetical protein A2452_07335 [Candidatus Firestonebacteria bacterium RIFOXYC2_FULL_39_67]